MLLAQCFAHAQTAEIGGFVRGPGGAGVPNASVELRNQDTGVRRRTATNGSGVYLLLGLQPGHYQATVQAAGFKTLTRDGIVLAAEERVRLDLRMEIAVRKKVATRVAALERTGKRVDSAGIPLKARGGPTFEYHERPRKAVRG
jgi:Carboxypeptidase regulatory-like domain